MSKPKPGTREALLKGCKCPVLDNRELPEGQYWISGDCPIHGKEPTNPMGRAK